MDVKLQVSFTSAPNVPAPSCSRKQPAYFYSLDTKLSGTLKSLTCEVLSLEESHSDLPGRTEPLCAGRGVLWSEAFAIRWNPTGTYTNITYMKQILYTFVCVGHATAMCRNPPTYRLTGQTKPDGSETHQHISMLYFTKI